MGRWLQWVNIDGKRWLRVLLYQEVLEAERLDYFLAVYRCGAGLVPEPGPDGILGGTGERNFRGFLFWTLLNLLCVVLVQVLVAIEGILGKHVIRKMNNQVRRDMAATMLQMSHGEFHKRQTGEYLSGFTKDIDQMGHLAWGPFFDWIGMAFTVMHSIIALSCLHWSLTVAALMSALIMSLAPKLFNKKMEAAGAVCTREQAKAVSKLKDLLAGYDVLRILAGTAGSCKVSQCSEEIEEPAFQRSRTQTITGKVLAVAGILCQGSDQYLDWLSVFPGRDFADRAVRQRQVDCCRCRWPEHSDGSAPVYCLQ